MRSQVSMLTLPLMLQDSDDLWPSPRHEAANTFDRQYRAGHRACGEGCYQRRHFERRLLPLIA